MKISLLTDQVAFLAHEAARSVNPDLPAWHESAEAQEESMLLVQSYGKGESRATTMYTEEAHSVFNRVLELTAYRKPPTQVASAAGFDLSEGRKFNGC